MEKTGKLKTYKSAQISDSFISIGFECLDRDLFKPEKCYDLLAETGVKYARCQTGWAKTEKVKGQYDFSWLDDIVENLSKRGIIPWFNVGFGNPLYMNDVPNETAVGCVPIYYGEQAVEAWKRFVFALSERYKDVVFDYEIWNEPNLGCFWHPQAPNARDYAKFLKLTATEIRKNNPNARIVANVNGYDCVYYTTQLLNCLEPGDINVFAYHAYTKLPEHKYSDYVKKIRKMLDEREMENVELWQGEAGFPSWAYVGHWLVPEGCNSERAQAIWQLRRYFLDIFNGATRSSFFQMADMWEKPYAKAVEVLNKPAAHGILNGKIYTPKKSYETISNLAAIFNGTVTPSDEIFMTELDGAGELEILSCQSMNFKKDGLSLYSYYIPTSVLEETQFSCTASLIVEHKLSSPVLVDTYTGEVFEVEKCQDHYGMCKYTGLPVKDYPLVLAEKDAFEIIT